MREESQETLLALAYILVTGMKWETKTKGTLFIPFPCTVPRSLPKGEVRQKVAEVRVTAYVIQTMRKSFMLNGTRHRVTFMVL